MLAHLSVSVADCVAAFCAGVMVASPLPEVIANRHEIQKSVVEGEAKPQPIRVVVDDITFEREALVDESPVESEPAPCATCKRQRERDELNKAGERAFSEAIGMARQGFNRNGTELTLPEKQLLWDIAHGKHLDSLVITPKATQLIYKMWSNWGNCFILAHVDNGDFSDETNQAIRDTRARLHQEFKSWKDELFREFNWQ